MGSDSSVNNFRRLPSSADDASDEKSAPRIALDPYLSDYPRWVDISDRFWSKVDRRGPSECWPFQGSVLTTGYGRFKFVSYRSIAASRAAYALHWRQDPGPLLVMHTCDNRQCCNPAHLVLGTVGDNSADMVAKGRWRGGDSKGEKNPGAKLTEDDVREIKRRIAAGHKNTHIAADFGVTHSLISAIRRGKIWSEVAS